jgi:hypothetical protein
VTGVQTCALPISPNPKTPKPLEVYWQFYKVQNERTNINDATSARFVIIEVASARVITH